MFQCFRLVEHNAILGQLCLYPIALIPSMVGADFALQISPKLTCAVPLHGGVFTLLSGKRNTQAVYIVAVETIWERRPIKRGSAEKG